MFFTSVPDTDINTPHRHETVSPSSTSSSWSLPSSWCLFCAQASTNPTKPILSALKSTLPELASRDTMATDALARPAMTAVLEQNPSRPERANSLRSNGTRTSKQKRASKPKSTYQLAYPPPSVTNRQGKLSIRPKLLLQLQQISNTSRPVPTLDVLPATTFGPRLGRKQSTGVKGRTRLGSQDLLILESENYSAASSSGRQVQTADDGSQATIATIRHLRKDTREDDAEVEIGLSDGLTWTARKLPRGGHEFSAVDEHGLKTVARWVPRSTLSGAHHGPTSASSPHGAREPTRSFGFSIVKSNRRRHPIIAALTPTSIEIVDSYPEARRAPDETEPQSPVRSLTGVSSGHSSLSMESHNDDRIDIAVDPALRTLVMITAVWVVFREGWSAQRKFETADPALPPLPGTASRSDSSAMSTGSNLSNQRVLTLDHKGLDSLSLGWSERSMSSGNRSLHRSSVSTGSGISISESMGALAHIHRSGDSSMKRASTGSQTLTGEYPSDDQDETRRSFGDGSAGGEGTLKSTGANPRVSGRFRGMFGVFSKRRPVNEART